MASSSSSSSSSSPSTWKYRVFTSFHGPDVRKSFLSHLRKQFNSNGITMFDDQGIERSQLIAPALMQAIRESRISIVVLSKNYASSSWCLDELLEILKCKEDIGQIVMTVFYGVDPSHVRKQTGDFGVAFTETCALKTEEERRNWSQALNYVGNIAGEHFLNWDNEAIMIEKIAKDVLDKLNATPSRDFEDMVGLEAHLSEMLSLLDLDNDGVKMVAIFGPAGIGKTTIARALYNLLSNTFQLTCFVDIFRESNHSGFDEYGLKLRLQEQFLSKVLNHSGLRICHLGSVKENLSDQKVLIILDDVNHIKQLEALANETTWFGPGSRIIVTTENKELLQQHGINNTYHVGFPSREEALKILCRYAFRQTSPRHGFKELTETIIGLCGKLPLGLCVVGSSLRGKKLDEWEHVVSRLETILDLDIEDVLRVGYESLDENEQTLFLHIAVFLNYRNVDLVKTMFADSDLNVNYGLKLLENRSLIEIVISVFGDQIVMHRLLQQVGKKAIHRQEPWKRKILIDAHEICDVLEDAKGTRAVSGISFDISNIDEVSISEKAFKRMVNLRFLRIYKNNDDGNYRMHIPEEMEFPRRLRLLDWEAYPSKSLPRTFHPEYLVELDLKYSQLEKLWEGIQPLKNLKYMDLTASKNLKELPDLSNATNLERLYLESCESLVEIPSSCSHLHKLEMLEMTNCINLQVIPAQMNLASLEWVNMGGCTRLRNIPVISTNITQLTITDVPPSIRLCSRLMSVFIRKSGKLNGLTHLPKSVKYVNLGWSDIERIPDCIKALHNLQTLNLRHCRRLISLPDCIKALHNLQTLNLRHCRRLASLPELPSSLILLNAENCESLETVFFPSSTPNAEINFTNCFKLGQQARRGIIRRSFCYSKTILPGREVPAEFDNRARGSSLTIVLDGNRSYIGFVFCVVFSRCNQPIPGYDYCDISWRRIIAQDDGYPVEDSVILDTFSECQTEHLYIFHYIFEEFYRTKVSREMMFEFSSRYLEIIECGAKILTQEESIEWRSDQASEDGVEFEPTEEAFEDNAEYGDPTNIDGEKQTDSWSWFPLKKRRKLCFEEEDDKKKAEAD